MVAALTFSYAIDHPAVPISSQERQWHQPLPVFRGPQGSVVPFQEQSPTVTYGDYFLAATDFLRGMLTKILEAVKDKSAPLDGNPEIRNIVIHLVKHGAFYHPAKVTLRSPETEIQLVLNVAVSTAGKALIKTEAANLERFGREFPQPGIPRLFALGQGAAPGTPALPMFAAQWFDGFCEFHLAQDPSGPEHVSWKVWDGPGDWWLSPDQTKDVFRQAAALLTYYYNPFTFEAVMDWHQAAGDFVIRNRKSDLDVRLITVRHYAPLVEVSEAEDLSLTDMLDGLMLFLIDMSLRLCLDRLDGVGPMVWAPDWVVPAIWQGFNQGLKLMAAFRGLPMEFCDGAVGYIAAHGPNDWIGLGREVGARRMKSTAETGAVQAHLADHLAILGKLSRMAKHPI